MLTRILNPCHIAILCPLLLLGCGGPQPGTGVANDTGAPAAPPQESTSVPTDESASSSPEDSGPPEVAVTDDWLRVAVPYRCVSGETVLAHYDDTTDTIRLRYRQTTVEMSPAVSASGARFTGGDWVWWTKGMDEGTLFTLLPDGDTGDLLDTCLAAGADGVPDGMENDPEDAAEVTGRATETSTDASIDLKNGTDAPAENR